MSRLRWLLLPTIALLLVAVTGHARVIHQERSLYSTILVNQQGSIVCLQFSVRRDQRNQSCYDRRRPDRIVFPYVHMLLGSLLLKPEPERILTIGLGGGTLPMALDRLLPEATHDVVEIDPAVVRVAREHFGFAPSTRVNVFAQDGRVFVKRALQSGTRYDLIVLDAFNGEYIPEHLMTAEFLREAAGLLTDDGVLAANTFAESGLYDHESATYAEVFGRYFNLRHRASGNRVILASAGDLPDPEVLAARAERLARPLGRFSVNLEEYLPLMNPEPDWDTDARILTDQYSPANLLR